MTSLSRRDLLHRSGATAMGIVFAGSIDAIAGPRRPAPPRRAHGRLRPAGPRPGRPARAAAGLLLHRSSPRPARRPLETGEPTPSDPTAPACFRGRDGGRRWSTTTRSAAREPYRRTARSPGLTYDPGARGGTTNIEVDKHGNRLREYVSVAGTHNNCAGGITPWGTWLTCEETEAARRCGGPRRTTATSSRSTRSTRQANTDPVPLKFLGRYAHEAVAVDPRTHAIYLTEDAGGPHGLYYRWTPPTRLPRRQGRAARSWRSAPAATPRARCRR